MTGDLLPAHRPMCPASRSGITDREAWTDAPWRSAVRRHRRGLVRGLAPGTRETDLLRPGTLVEQAHAVLLTGGAPSAWPPPMG